MFFDWWQTICNYISVIILLWEWKPFKGNGWEWNRNPINNEINGGYYHGYNRNYHSRSCVILIVRRRRFLVESTGVDLSFDVLKRTKISVQTELRKEIIHHEYLYIATTGRFSNRGNIDFRFPETIELYRCHISHYHRHSRIDPLKRLATVTCPGYYLSKTSGQ
jgi:hypothetical protein